MRQNLHLFAYLDAGTGSMILQIVLGGAAAVALAGRVFWHRIMEFFGRKTDPTPNASPDTLSEATASSPERTTE